MTKGEPWEQVDGDLERALAFARSGDREGFEDFLISLGFGRDFGVVTCLRMESIRFPCSSSAAFQDLDLQPAQRVGGIESGSQR